MEQTEKEWAVEWLTRDNIDSDVAARMVKTAMRVGENLDYPFPVVTTGVNGKIGLRWELETGSFVLGYSFAVGDRD